MTKSIKIAQQTAHETERYTCPQAVVWCGFDENLEQGARCKK
jgi:transcription initiation factor IIE alpha subunit